MFAGINDVESLSELFSIIERMTGLEVTVYRAIETHRIDSILRLPVKYRKHMSEFCRLIKNNKTGKGCGGHDCRLVNIKAGKIGAPFVNICHAGIAEAIVPVYDKDKHIATVFIGQALLEENVRAAEKVLARAEALSVDKKKIRSALNKLPVKKEEELLDVARLTNLAVKGFADSVGLESMMQEVMLERSPKIKKALEIMSQSRKSFSAAELAGKVFLEPSYFSRLFRKVMQCSFSDFVAEQKINLAMKLLHETRLPVMEIAGRCGYSKVNYFNRVFKSWTGMTPSQYRKQSDKKTEGKKQ